MLVLLLVLAVGAVSATPDDPPPSPPSSTSDVCPDPNAIRKDCVFGEACRPTCDVPNVLCPQNICIKNGCECKPGYILSATGGNYCIPIEECPRDGPCNGDPNAVFKVRPIPCPSTCASPYAQPYCTEYPPEYGCECKPGYLKSSNDIDGKCIKPDSCPGGNPCGVNGTFVGCYVVGCPHAYCPVSDSRADDTCYAKIPCPSGCACKLNYRRKSFNDDSCILASECPAVECTRPNEVWSGSPPPCLREYEYCRDFDNQPTTCNTGPLDSQPQCICEEGYCRDDYAICIPPEQYQNNLTDY